jgi:ribosomal protein S18 acetylase RimI-like enzyme
MPEIREIKPTEHPFLNEMLYEAVFVRDGEDMPPRTVLEPYVTKYVNRFGRSGDLALVLEANGELVGAIWARQFSKEEQGYGFIDASTPELGMAIREPFRGQGLGTRMIAEILERLGRNGVEQVSLSVDKRNPALRLYERCGFEIVEERGKGYTMLKKL